MSANEIIRMVGTFWTQLSSMGTSTVPVESRRIDFSTDEVISAAVGYCHEAHIPVPTADCQDFSIGADPRRRLTLTFAVDSPVDLDEVVLSDEQLLDALVRFCRVNEIPLPSEAAKGVKWRNGTLSMRFQCRRRTRYKSGLAA